MRLIIILPISVGVILSIFFGIFSDYGENKLILETYKLALSFTLIGVFGALVKAAIDENISRKDDEARRYQEWENQKANILQAFIDIFSEFYSIRKLYHSAMSTRNSIYTVKTPEFEALVREVLKKAVELEGRYGALKVWIIRHFNLPGGDFGYKSKQKLMELKEDPEIDLSVKHRHALDLLGEAYDDWRHAIEGVKKN